MSQPKVDEGKPTTEHFGTQILGEYILFGVRVCAVVMKI